MWKKLIKSSCFIYILVHFAGVTEDAALNVLSQASEQTKLLKQDFLTIPAVWGFIGYKHFVDICSMKLKHRTDMTDGTILSEERQMMPFHDHLQPIWEETSSSAGNILNQVSATVDLMNEWFSDKPSGRTFSAAVLSDGTFDIPSGLYFSQPVICVDHEWIPDSQHPPPMEKISLEDLYRDVLPTLESHQLGKWRRCRSQTSFVFASSIISTRWKVNFEGKVSP